MLYLVLSRVRFCTFNAKEAYQMLHDMFSMGVPILPFYGELLTDLIQFKQKHLDVGEQFLLLQLLRHLRNDKPNRLLEWAIEKLLWTVGNDSLKGNIMKSQTSISAYCEDSESQSKIFLGENLVALFFSIIMKDVRLVSNSSVEYYITHELKSCSSLTGTERATIQAILVSLFVNPSVEASQDDMIRVASASLAIHRLKINNFLEKIAMHVQRSLLSLFERSSNICSELDITALVLSFISLTVYVSDEFYSKQCQVVLLVLREIAHRDSTGKAISISRIGHMEICVNRFFSHNESLNHPTSKINEITQAMLALLQNRVSECSVDLCVKCIILLTRINSPDKHIGIKFLGEIRKKFEGNDSSNKEILGPMKGRIWVTLLFCQWKLGFYGEKLVSFAVDRIIEAARSSDIDLNELHKALIYTQKMKFESNELIFLVIRKVHELSPNSTWDDLMIACRSINTLYNIRDARTHESYLKAVDMLKDRIKLSTKKPGEWSFVLMDVASLLFILSFHIYEVTTVLNILKHLMQSVELTARTPTSEKIFLEIACSLKNFHASEYQFFFKEHRLSLRKIFLHSLKISKHTTLNQQVRVISAISQILSTDSEVEKEIQRIVTDIPRRATTSQITDRSISILLTLLARKFKTVDSSVFVALLESTLPQTSRTSLSILKACSVKGISPSKRISDHIMQQIATPLSSLTIDEITIVCRAFWQLRIKPSIQLLEAIKSIVAEKSSTMHIHACSIILRTLCLVHQSQNTNQFFANFFKSIELAMIRDQAVRPTNLIRILSSLSSVKYPSDKLEEMIFKYLSNEGVLRDLDAVSLSWINELYSAMETLKAKTRFRKLHDYLRGRLKK